MSATPCHASSRVLTRLIAFIACLAIHGTAGLANAATTDPPATEQKDIEHRYNQAADLFGRGETSRALELFIQLSKETDSPNVQLYVGYCQQRLGRLREAHRAFSLSARRAAELGDAKYHATMQAAQDELTVLGLQLAKLTISLAETPAGVAVLVDGEALNPNDFGSPIVVGPGNHHIEATAAGLKTVRREVSLDKGDSKTVTLLFEKQETSAPVPSRNPPLPQQPSAPTQPAPASSLTSLGLIAGGVGVVGLGVFGIAGLKARSANDRLASECSSLCSDEEHRSTANQGKTYQLVANTGLALGIVGVLSGATLFYLGASKKGTPTTSVGFAPGLARITVEGRF